MNRIDELIAQLCPEGVEFRAIGELTSYVRGITYDKNEERQVGPIRVLRSNNISLSSNTLNFDDVKTVSANVRVRDNQWLRANDILISAASGSKAHIGKAAFIYEDIDYCFGGFMGVLRSSGQVDSRFLFHLLVGRTFSEYLQSALSTTTINNLNASIMNAFRIPIPPLEVQREIVKVLDAFTALEAELAAALAAELAARRQQYAHYRDALLSFDGREDVRWMALGEVGAFVRGRRFTKEDYADEGIPCIHYGEIYTRYGVSASVVVSHIDAGISTRLRYARTGDVVLTDVGETVEDVGKAVAWLGADEVAIHDHCYAFRHSMNPVFVSYCMQTTAFIIEKAKYVARTKVNTLLISGFSRMRIPVPPLEEQARIVAILDQFDALVNDISSGLPAEIAARRQQYAHYRDRLLSFREAV